ncbi:hypothetical protein J6590_083702 [Homalodisca vitripennis]|nr:hypothetical protein J6590_083702 [Homalodisca vitripennis]
MYKAETTIGLGNTRQQAAAPAHSPAYRQAGIESQVSILIVYIAEIEMEISEVLQ